MAENRYKDELFESFFAIWLVSCDLLVAIGVLVGVWLVDKLIRFLWPGPEPTMFGKIPLRMIIETADGGILIVFLSFGLYRAGKTVRSRL